MDIGFVEVSPDITLRRFVMRNLKSKGVVLLLHGFPETIYAWREIALALANDFEIHAFDWPGFGLSSRPSADKFSYSPQGYAQVLRSYIEKASINSSQLTIYATDIGALPALLLALEQPGIAKSIIVGDFAPLNRPAFMWESLQALKSEPAANQVRAFMNANRDEILANTFYRGLPVEAYFEVSTEFRDDMAHGWNHGEMTSVDAFYHYYSHFSRDQEYFEENLERLKTPVTVMWGTEDLYIKKEMGFEFAEFLQAELRLLPGIGHYPHLQAPEKAIEEIHASFR